MGWVVGIEPTIFGTTIRRFNQLSHTHHKNCQKKLVRPTGFEPVAYCLEGSCSIQLSYGRILERVMGIEPTQPAWKAGILAIELHPHLPFPLGNSGIIPNQTFLVNTFFSKKYIGFFSAFCPAEIAFYINGPHSPPSGSPSITVRLPT